MKLTKGKIIAALAVVCLLVAAFFLQGQDGGSQPEQTGSSQQGTVGNNTPEASVSDTKTDTGEDAENEADRPDDAGEQKPEESAPEKPDDEKPEEQKPAESEPEQREPAEKPEEAPAPVPEEPKALTCTFSITCATVLDNLDKLTPGKEGLIPADGWLLPETQVEFTAGDTVFDVLQRELKSRNMHFEYSTAALYDTAYIEGICNLYEYDCGELSGWEYVVNGTFYSYGSSQFTLNDGDVVSWVYTCDLGADVGDVR